LVDGILVDRNVGEFSHQMALQEVLFYLRERRRAWNIFVIQGLRVRVSPTRYLVPDVCVVLGEEPDEETLAQPPFRRIKILSRENRIGPHAGAHRRLFQNRSALRVDLHRARFSASAAAKRLRETAPADIRRVRSLALA
jgi:hypothetical protein